MLVETEKDKDPKLDDVMMPMIDVVFLLLIFFMVCSKFKTLDAKLVTHLPKDMGEQSAATPDVTPTYIRLETFVWGVNNMNRPCTKEVRIVVGDKVIGQYVQPYFGKFDPKNPDSALMAARTEVFNALLSELRQMVEDGLAGEQESACPTVILPDPRVPCDDVIQAIDIIQAAGLENVSFGGHVADLDKLRREDDLPPDKWNG